MVLRYATRASIARFANMKLLIGDFLSRDSAAGKHVDDNGRSAVQQQSLLALMDGGEIFLQEICPPHNSRTGRNGGTDERGKRRKSSPVPH